MELLQKSLFQSLKQNYNDDFENFTDSFDGLLDKYYPRKQSVREVMKLFYN